MPKPSSQPQESLFRRRLNALWQDKRPWKKRLVLAAACSFAFFFTVAFFGPVELTAYNVYSLTFCVQEIWLLMAACTLVGTVLMSLALSVLRGRVYDTAICLVFSLELACYIQGTFLGGGDALTGDAIHWEDRLGSMLANALFWMLVVLAIFLLHYFDKKLWRRAACFCSALIVLMQSTALVSMGLQGMYDRTLSDYRSYLSRENMYSFSAQVNLLVVIVDRMDMEYIEEILRRDPAFFDFLDGFTSYTNATSEYVRTTPGANAVLTGYHEGAYQTPRYKFYDNSWDWEGRHLLHDLADIGCTVDLYAERTYMFGGGPEADTYVRNSVSEGGELFLLGPLKGLLNLSGYRYSPLVCKPFFWTDMGKINRGSTVQANQFYIDDIVFSNGLENMQVGQQEDSFRLIHLNGSHAPFTLNADGSPSEIETTAVEQTMGCFRILGKMFDRMRELGIYEDAAIIITADHGWPPIEHVPLTEPMTIGMFYKPAGSAGTPLAVSDAPVSNTNIPATILKNAGVDYSAYGLALDEVTAELQPVRYFFMPCKGTTMEETLLTYEIGPDATDFSNWEIVDTQPITYSFWP